jgi:hypothetical protein
MKDLRVSASATVAAAPEACTALLAAVDGYPSWYPDVIREAEVLERDRGGTPVRARATVHLALGPIVHDLELVLTVDVEPGRHVTLTLVTDRPSDTDAFKLSWTIDPGPPTRLDLELSARVDVPRFLPVGSLGGPLAQGFVDAASRALAGSSPKASATSS